MSHLSGMSSSLHQPSSAVPPEMESLLTDMLMAWYQSGYTTGRYYTMLEQQQQQMQQWYAYYQQTPSPSGQHNGAKGSHNPTEISHQEK
jgi:hypothetical protein